MPKRHSSRQGAFSRLRAGGMPAAGVLALSAALALQGCFDPVYPQLDRDARVIEALGDAASRDLPPVSLTASQAVAYALAHNLDAKVAEIEAAYQNESLVAARRRLLPSLTVRYSPSYSNHPAARWSESTKSGSESLESSFSSEQFSRQGEVGAVWNLIDFGVGYLRSRQQGERILHAEQQRRRVRQQVVLDVLSQYWRASAAMRIAAEAEGLRAELEKQGESIRDSVELRILSGAEGARRELSVYGSLAELDQYRRQAAQAKLELAKVLGCGGTVELHLADFSDAPARIPNLPDNDPWMLQAAALKRRPELFQQDTQERIAVDEARLALLQMAPNANLSLSLYDDPDKFLEWNNWMTAGVRVSWNLLNIPARVAERRMAKLQKETAKQKGLALAAAVMAQVGIAFSDWRLARDYASSLERRAVARERLVEALAAGEKDGQTRPGEVLQERVRLLSEKAAALRTAAEVRVAGARLANAIGLDADDDGNLLWRPDDSSADKPCGVMDEKRAEVLYADLEAERVFPAALSGLKVIKAEDFLTPDDFFANPNKPAARPPKEAPKEKEPAGERDGDKASDKAGSGKKSSSADAKKTSRNDEAKASDKKSGDRPAAKKRDEEKPATAPAERDPKAAPPEADSRPGDGEKDAGGGRPDVKKTGPGKAPAKKRRTNQLQAMSPPGLEIFPDGTLPRTVFVDNFPASSGEGGAPARMYRIESQPVETLAPGSVVYDPLPPAPYSLPDLMESASLAGGGAKALPASVAVEAVNTSSAGSLPFAVGGVDEELVRRGRERDRALAPLQALPREKRLRPPVTEVRIPSLKPPGE